MQIATKISSNSRTTAFPGPEKIKKNAHRTQQLIENKRSASQTNPRTQANPSPSPSTCTLRPGQPSSGIPQNRPFSTPQTRPVTTFLPFHINHLTPHLKLRLLSWPRMQIATRISSNSPTTPFPGPEKIKKNAHRSQQLIENKRSVSKTNPRTQANPSPSRPTCTLRPNQPSSVLMTPKATCARLWSHK
jgi:hypothetical protein